MDIRIVPLGAGQDVGRSCVVVELGGRRVMFDCGMHMGYHDKRRFPNFEYIAKHGHMDEAIDLVIISHFHLDHCGALPHFTEQCGYNGPVIMSGPTKAICPILLEDFRKIMVERKGEKDFFTSAMISACMKKVVPMNVHETVTVDEDFEVKCYYAGHVLGASMFYVRVGTQSVLYTGDYNVTPDRHLGGAWVDCVRPDVLITETTYATLIRDSKRSREQDFLNKVKNCVEAGGKVLIPVFALGRAQELCILIDTFWSRMNLTVPIFFAQGLTSRANEYYKLFINWTNQSMKETFSERNKFDFTNIRMFDRSYIRKPGPMVVFATPGMLHAGLSLEIFKHWAPDEKNMVIMPGYCVAGTVGNKILSGQKKIVVDNRTTIDVRCKVEYLSFSAHVDAKGIMQTIRQTQPKSVMLVHGERKKMEKLKERIVAEFGIECVNPPNGTSVTLQSRDDIPIEISTELIDEATEQNIALLAVGSKGGTVGNDDDDDDADEADDGDETMNDADDGDGDGDGHEDCGGKMCIKRSSSSIVAAACSASSSKQIPSDEKKRARKKQRKAGLPHARIPVKGVLMAESGQPLRLVPLDQALPDTMSNSHTVSLSFVTTCSSAVLPNGQPLELLNGIRDTLEKDVEASIPWEEWVQLSADTVHWAEHSIQLAVQPPAQGKAAQAGGYEVRLSWVWDDDAVATKLKYALEALTRKNA